MDARWRAASQDRVAWRVWEGEAVVFDERSGSTHHLGPIASRVFRCLLDAPAGRSVAELEATLAASPAPAGAAAIEATLADLARLGLVTPPSP